MRLCASQTTVCLFCSYTLSLETGADVGKKAGGENFLFLYAHYALIATRKLFHFLSQTLSTSYVGFQHNAVATYINMYHTFIHTYTF